MALTLVWAMAGSVLLAPCAPAGAQGAPGKEAELQQVRTRIEAIRKAIQADAERRDSLAAQLKKSDLAIQAARERLERVREERRAAEARLQALKAEHAQTERQVAAERAALAGEVRMAYMNGREERLKLLLNQGDPARLGRMMAYYGYLGRARADRIQVINDRLAHLELLTESIAAETNRLRALEDERSEEVNRLADARQARARTLASVQSQIKSRSDQLAKLEREARALEKLLEELRRAIEDFPQLAEQPFERVKGKLPWPVPGKLIARYGELRAGGPLKWQGWLIATERGTQVRAPYYGRVVYADWLPGMGLLIVLDHGNGYMSLYGHNEQLYRSVGDKVSPGDPLATVGNSGHGGQPGLYLEIRKGRQALDPAAWMVRR